MKIASFEKVATGCGASEVSVQGGGVAATGAASVARLGGRVRFYTRVGNDYFGNFIVKGLKDIGVDIEAAMVEGAGSPVCTVLVDSEGERKFIYFPGRDLELPDYVVPEEEVAASGAVLIDGRWPEASVDCAHKAYEHGVPIVLDIGHSRPHEKELLKIADFPVLSTVMLGGLGVYPAERERLAAEVLKNGRCEIVLVTCGAEGVEMYRRSGEGVEVKPFPALRGNVYDTCGAGDAFHGAFAYGVSQGWDIERVVNVAQATGLLTCRALGGRASLPTMAEVEETLAAQGQ